MGPAAACAGAAFPGAAHLANVSAAGQVAALLLAHLLAIPSS
ncbi:MAG: hypothetical protein ACLQK8_04230 [Streptosporangiaceae bacterium]